MATFARAAALAAALLVAACASRPVALVALPPAPAAERTGAPGPSVLLREVTIPGYLNGFPVVVARHESTLRISPETEWAERPSDGVARVLSDALSQRLDPARVLIQGDGRIPDADLTVEFLALDPREGALHLDARWHFACTRGASRGGRTQLEVPMSSATPPAVASATTQALARFADVLASAIPTECQPSTHRALR